MPSESHPEPPETFYLTTPIYYVNARPHIGHAYSTIVADVLARRHRLLGHDTFFLTGTDEHGQKIERSAAAAGIPPQEFADQVSKTFSGLWRRMGITNDAFIRTTDPRHKQGVQRLFQTLYDQGHIYLSTYTGQYSIGEEMFVEGPPGTIGPDGRPTETVTEENFFFRLSNFQRPLLDLIESDSLKITPESSRNEVLSFLTGNLRTVLDPLIDVAIEGATSADDPAAFLPSIEQLAVERGLLHRTATGRLYVPGALKDLSISRSSFTWGIPVPEAVQQAAKTTQPHVIYVWLDALANYMTAIGYGSNQETDQQQFQKYWPANLHVVGKEITRFHCVYWPAFLLALNPRLSFCDPPSNPVISTGLPASSSSAPPPNLVILNEVKDPRISPGVPNRPWESVDHKAWAAQWLPKAITANGWLLFDNSKMSKSKGNVVRTETILEAFGEHVYKKQFPDSTNAEQDLFAADVLRYYLLREIPFGQDGSFSFDSMWARYDSELGSRFGNLVSRCLSMIGKYFQGIVPAPPVEQKVWAVFPNTESEAHEEFLLGTNDTGNLVRITRKFFDDSMTKFEFDFALLCCFSNAAMVDRYITTRAPWKLAGPDDREILAEVLYTAAESIRIITAHLHPFLPTATGKVWVQLGLGSIETAAANGDLKNLQWGGLKPGTKLGPLSPIFPRADKSLITLMEDLEAAANPPKEKNPMPTEDTSQQPADPQTHPAAPLKGAAPAGPITLNPGPSPSDPAAPPRTSTLETENPGGQVAASHAITTEREGTPPHTEAQASGIFSSTAGAGQPETPQITPQIGIDDFTKIDLRVAKILVAERIPKADKLLRLEVDLGYEQRQILSGIAEHYTPEELIGKKIVIIANLAPRTMRKLVSHGMLLAASEGENGKPILATFGEDIAVGTRLR